MAQGKTLSSNGESKGGVQAPQPVLTLGLALCCLGGLGLLKQLLILLAMVPLAFWASLAVFAAGLSLVLVEQLRQLLADSKLHLLPGQLMRRQMQTGQRLYVLSSFTSPSREDVRIILSGVSPTLAALLAAEDLQTAASAIAEAVLPFDLSGDSFVANLWQQLLQHLQDFGIGVCSCPNPVCKCNHGSAHTEQNMQAAATLQVEQEAEGVAEAVAWLRRPQLTLSFQDQLQLYGLARQAVAGDVGEKSSGSSLQLAKHQSWERHRGMDRTEAGRRLVQRLLEIDPIFRSARPQNAPPAPSSRTSGISDMVSMVAELLQRRLPGNAEELAACGKRRALALLLASSFLLSLLRRSALPQRLFRGAKRLPLVALTGATSAAYLSVLSFGLPARVHLKLPRALKALPDTASKTVESALGSEQASRLLRWLIQNLMPPVATPLLQD
mmetsp:Transcript_922/g.1828  ORF Transcript_922/g.1828 Transcript_922/m.1828 type:complete len:441 (+) Transcript_922:57-1379(+)